MIAFKIYLLGLILIPIIYIAIIVFYNDDLELSWNEWCYELFRDDGESLYWILSWPAIILISGIFFGMLGVHKFFDKIKLSKKWRLFNPFYLIMKGMFKIKNMFI